MSLSCSVFEILPLFWQNFRWSRDPGHASLGDSMSSVDEDYERKRSDWGFLDKGGGQVSASPSM